MEQILAFTCMCGFWPFRSQKGLHTIDFKGSIFPFLAIHLYYSSVYQ